MKKPLLDAFKAKFWENLGVRAAIDSGKCLACHQAGVPWRSEGGKKEFERTGLCEDCWDAVSLGQTERGVPAQEQCVRLNDAGLQTAGALLQVTPVMDHFCTTEAHYREIVEVTTGRQRLADPQ